MAWKIFMDGRDGCSCTINDVWLKINLSTGRDTLKQGVRLGIRNFKFFCSSYSGCESISRFRTAARNWCNLTRRDISSIHISV